MFAASLSLNVYLGWKLQRPAATEAGRAEPVAIGTRIPVLTAKDEAGRDVTIDWAADSRTTVLYVFSPSCQWCRRNLPNIGTLVKEQSFVYRFVGLSLSDIGLAEFVAQGRLPFPIYRPSQEGRASLGLGSTPETIVVSRNGTVLKAWLGAYASPRLRDVEGFFRVKLPGLDPR
jgi:hypothetical protein